jgi:hypothetical protein
LLRIPNGQPTWKLRSSKVLDTLDKDIIFDYPKQFVTDDGSVKNLSEHNTRYYTRYPYKNDVSDISNLIREYIDTPKDELLTKQFLNDHWGLIDILHAADRRIGTRRLEPVIKETNNIAAYKVVEARLRNPKGDNPGS